jgi:hypothetical protein
MNKDPMLYADGFEECIIGVFTEGEVPRVVYDKWAMVEVLMESDLELSWEDSVEFLEFNVWGAYHGEGTPVYLRTFSGTPDEKMDEIDIFVSDMYE